MTQPYTARDDIFRRDDWNRPNESQNDSNDGEGWDVEPKPAPSAPESRVPRWLLAVGFVLLLGGGVAIWYGLSPAPEQAPPDVAPPDEAQVGPPPTQRPFAKNILLETQGTTKRVVVKARICLREGALEGLLTIATKKEHEFITAADIDAHQLHLALIAVGAEPGAPAMWEPKYRPARGTKIHVKMRYKKGGKTVVVPAREWIQYDGTGKTLDHPWVFAGSQFVDNPFDEDGEKLYAAIDGDLICVSNFPSAMLDLPIASSDQESNLLFIANTERIPPLETPIEVLLEPEQ